MNIPKFRYIKGTLYIDKETYDRDVMQVKEYKEDEINRLSNIINYIWQVFENGSFEDGCDCIKIYDYLKELKENNNAKD